MALSFRLAPPCTHLRDTMAASGRASTPSSVASGDGFSTLTVVGSMTVTVAPNRLDRSVAPVAGSRIRSSENLTSSAVTGVPSWNFTSGRRWNTMLRASGCSHRWARRGTTAPVLS
ncbi:hypothetical protein D3C72_1963790 [compost metagenome]